MLDSQINALSFDGKKEDELQGYSWEDTLFLKKVIREVQHRPDGMLEFPLPFKENRQQFPNNSSVAFCRTKSTLQNMKKKHPEVFRSTLEKFDKNLQADPPRFIPVPPEDRNPLPGEAYWLPIFSVWQKGKARVVFDAAAKMDGVCMNENLLQCPDRNNSIRAVILRFKQHPYAVTADIANMFHQIAVPKEHSTYMRFFWYKDNDPEKQLIEYYSRVHLMGYTSSPAIANLAVRYAARQIPPANGLAWIDEDKLLDPHQSHPLRTPDSVEKVLSKQFYVDDLMASAATPEEAKNLLQEGITRLARYELKLCKIQSNCAEIRDFFPAAESLPAIVDLSPADPSNATPQMGHSLGLQWDTVDDLFRVKMEFKVRPKTKRGLLGHTMAIYDPLGQVAPATLSCKLLQREIFSPKYQDPHNLQGFDWDDAIPEQFHRQWDDMLKTVQEVQEITTPLSFYSPGNGKPAHQHLYGFADASDLAICYVIYLRTVTENGHVDVAFVTGNSKVIERGVSVKGKLSIPRAELCAADALAMAMLQVTTDLDGDWTGKTTYYSDSRDVLGWIESDITAPPRYITTRRDRIRLVSSPSQWNYIGTKHNPADIGTRPISVKDLKASRWITGPPFLRQDPVQVPDSKSEPPPASTIPQEKDQKIASILYFNKQPIMDDDITTGKRWETLLQTAIVNDPTLDRQLATVQLLLQMQKDVFPNGIQGIHQEKSDHDSKKAQAMSLLPDSEGLIRCGGRLENSSLTLGRRQPILIPNVEAGDALIGYLHNGALHQGRKITLGAIRDAGYIPFGGRRRISKLINGCMTCRIQRAAPMQQKMADLPSHRLHKTPPFWHSGMDVFGPFQISHGRHTRGQPGKQKIWVLLFTCLYSRGTHMETLESMDAASFRMAFQRFQALRGDCVYLRSDAGSNFMGARNEEQKQ